jgi:hypothetical protein
MGSWRDVAAAVAQRQEPVRPNSGASFGLPDNLAASIHRLETLPPPRKLEHPENWPGVVADALTIAREGWAAKALALGWTAGDLFGIGARDDWDFQGLALWLNGRRILMLDAKHAIVAGNQADYRSAFTRGGMRHGTHPTVTPVMLWDFGR